MKKVLLLMFTILTLGVVNVSAKKVYADLSKLSNGPVSTWDASTSTITWTGQSNNMISNFDFAAGDYRSYDKIVVSVSDLNNAIGVRVQIKANGQEKVVALNGEGTFEKSLTTDFGFTVADLLNLEWIRLLGSGWYDGESHAINVENPASAKIGKVYLSKPTALLFNEAGEAEFDLSDLVATGGFSFDEKTGVLTNDGTGGTLSINMPTEGIDFTHITSLTVNRSGDDIVNNSEIKDTKNNISNGFWGSKYGINFTTGDAMKFNSATNVDFIAWYGNSTAGTMTISSIKVKANVITCSVPGTPVSLNTLQYHNFPSGTNATATWNVNTATDTYYGSGSSDPINYVDLTGYEVLRIHRDDATGFRAFFINAGGTGTNKIDDRTTGTVSWDEAGKYWEIDLSKVEKYQGKVYLNTIKSASWGLNNVVKAITVYKTPEGAANYILAGKGALTPAAVAALADPNAKIYDATGVTSTGLELTPTNPNALFVANEGTLTNDKNVCVNDNISHLELTDGYPFACPAGATAAEASYSRAMSNAWGTICLPFEMASTESYQFYTISGIVDDMLMIEEQATLPAGAPALVNVKNGGFDVTAQNVDLKDVQVSNSTYPLIGTYEATGVAVKEDVNYYAISNNQFVQATSIIFLPAFRAYFTAPKSSAANLRIPAGEATAIKALTGEGEVSVVGIYSANGTQQRSLQKGINVVKLSNGATQKILVK